MTYNTSHPLPTLHHQYCDEFSGPLASGSGSGSTSLTRPTNPEAQSLAYHQWPWQDRSWQTTTPEAADRGHLRPWLYIWSCGYTTCQIWAVHSCMCVCRLIWYSTATESRSTLFPVVQSSRLVQLIVGLWFVCSWCFCSVGLLLSFHCRIKEAN